MTDTNARDPRYLPFAPAPAPEDGPRALHAMIEDLSRPIHASYLKTKKKGGAEISFINWYTAARILDKYAPGWQYETRTTLSLDGQHVVVDARLGLPTSDYGVVWRGASGSDEDDEKAYGDASDRAESQALRRAASKFGLALYLYYEKGADGPTQRNPKAITSEPAPQRTERPATVPAAQSPAHPPAAASQARTAPAEGDPLAQVNAALKVQRERLKLTDDEVLTIMKERVRRVERIALSNVEDRRALLKILETEGRAALPDYAAVGAV